MDYYSIQDLAKQYKATSPDFYCLSSGHDPFYMRNDPHAHLKGEWFADLYRRYWSALGDPIVRSLHYAILHHEVYLTDGKTRYINLDAHYEKLQEAAKCARYLELVPMSVIEETKNEPDVFVPPVMPQPKLDIKSEYYYGIDLYSFPDQPHYSLTTYPHNQRYNIEIWCEKIYGPLKELARKYGAVWQPSQGEQTVKCVQMITERRKQYNRPVRIFYISDFDPAGTSMPVAVSRKLEYLLDDIRGNAEEPDVRLYNLVLTQEQVTKYQLPRTPLKPTEKRKDVWQAIHGEDAVELNAIEAQPQYKGELVRIVEEAILHYYDKSLSTRAGIAEMKFNEQLEGIQQDIYWRYPQLAILKNEYDEIVTEVSPRLDALNAEISRLWQQISDDLNCDMPDFEEHLKESPLPEPTFAQEIADPLYDSHRDYFSQLAIYKAHQGKRIVF